MKFSNPHYVNKYLHKHIAELPHLTPRLSVKDFLFVASVNDLVDITHKLIEYNNPKSKGLYIHDVSKSHAIVTKKKITYHMNGP